MQNIRHFHVLPTDRQAVIGIHCPNGVLAEAECTRGTSYILDHLLYEKLSREIQDNGSGTVRAITEWGYSSFFVICPPESAPDNLNRMLSALQTPELPTEVLEPWAEELRAWNAGWS